MKKLLCALLIVTAAAASADEDAWAPVTTDASGNIWTVSSSSLQRTGDAVVFWTRVVRQKPARVFPKNPKSPTYVRFMAQWGIDCRARTVWDLYETYQAADGSAVHSEQGTGRPLPIAPESVGDGLRQHVCR